MPFIVSIVLWTCNSDWDIQKKLNPTIANIKLDYLNCLVALLQKFTTFFNFISRGKIFGPPIKIIFFYNLLKNKKILLLEPQLLLIKFHQFKKTHLQNNPVDLGKKQTFYYKLSSTSLHPLRWPKGTYRKSKNFGYGWACLTIPNLESLKLPLSMGNTYMQKPWRYPLIVSRDIND